MDLQMSVWASEVAGPDADHRFVSAVDPHNKDQPFVVRV